MIALIYLQDNHAQHVTRNFFSGRSLEHGATLRRYDQIILGMEIAELKDLSYYKHKFHQDKNFSPQFSYPTQ